MLNDQAHVLPGVYILRSISGWTDSRNGHLPFIVAAYFDWVSAIDPDRPLTQLNEFEQKLGVPPL